MIKWPTKSAQSRSAGFSIIEVILASALFVTFATASITVVIQGLDANRLAGEQAIANQYADEGMEAVRSIKNQAFSNLVDSAGTNVLRSVSNLWAFGAAGPFDKYTRTVMVAAVNRDVSGNIVSSGGSVDPLTKKITSTAAWNVSGNRNDSAAFISYLTDYRRLISSGNGLAFYGDTTTTQKYRLYDNSVPNFGTETATVVGAAGRSFGLKTSPIKVEAIAGYVTSTGTLQIMCFDGSVWTNDWSISVGGTGTTKRFAIGYETNSGDVLVLYSRNVATPNELGYKTKLGTTGCGAANWSVATNLDPVRTSGIVQWVKLAPDPRSSSNIIAAVWADANSDLSAMIWNGSAWVNEPAAALETALEVASAAQDVDSFDVSYESVLGNLMVVWGSGGNANTNGAFYNRCTNGTATCTWGAKTAITGMANDATNLDISSNPNTNEIVFASIGNAGSDLQVAYWSGSAWTGTNDIDATAQTPLAGTKLVATGWLINGAVTKSVILYNNSTTTTIQGYTGAAGVFTRQGGADPAPWFTPAPAFANPQKWYDVQMDPFNKNTLIFSIADNNNDLFVKRLTMDSAGVITMINVDSSAAIELTLGQAIANPFAFAHWRHQ